MTPETGRKELHLYVIGFALAAALTAVPFAVVASGTVPRNVSGWVIALCALLQTMIHFRCFLHIDLSRQKREDLQLVLFSVLLLALMAGGTIWVLANLSARMMP